MSCRVIGERGMGTQSTIQRPATLSAPAVVRALRENRFFFIRSLVVTTSVVILMTTPLRLDQWDPFLFMVSALLVALSERLAIPRRTVNGVVSFTFVPLAMAAILLGPLPAALLGLFSAVLGDGVLRRRTWGQVGEKAAALALMLTFGAWVSWAMEAPPAAILAFLPHFIMTFWFAAFAAWTIWLLKREERWTADAGQGVTVLLLILGLWSHPLWLNSLAPVSPAVDLGWLPAVFVMTAGFMFLDNVLTSVTAISVGGVKRLAFWRYSLLPAFMQYNVLAVGALLLIWSYQMGGNLGLLTTSLLVVLTFYIYRLHEKAKDMLLSSMCAFATALDARDPYTYGHSDRVAGYAVALAKAIGLPTGRQRRIQLAAQLHDIGKIGIPDAVLLKPGRFTPEEFDVMKGHVQHGVQILWNIPDLREVAQIIEQEHERLDGTGYPKGLAGDEIGLEARIISVADVYDALTTNRPYRDASTPEQALKILEGLAGKDLDPALVTAFREAQQTGEAEAELAFAYCLTN